MVIIIFLPLIKADRNKDQSSARLKQQRSASRCIYTLIGLDHVTSIVRSSENRLNSVKNTRLCAV